MKAASDLNAAFSLLILINAGNEFSGKKSDFESVFKKVFNAGSGYDIRLSLTPSNFVETKTNSC